MLLNKANIDTLYKNIKSYYGRPRKHAENVTAHLLLLQIHMHKLKILYSLCLRHKYTQLIGQWSKLWPEPPLSSAEFTEHNRKQAAQSDLPEQCFTSSWSFKSTGASSRQ